MGSQSSKASSGRRDRRGGSRRFPRQGQRTGGCCRHGPTRPSSRTSPSRAPVRGRALVRPGMRKPSPPGPFVLGAAAPAGEARAGRGLAGPRRLVRGPGLPGVQAFPGRPECCAGNKGAAGPRCGAPGAAGRVPEARALPRRPDLDIPRPFLREEPRCEESLRWVGAFTQSLRLGK